MGRKVLQVKGFSAEDINKLIRTDDRYTIGIRLYAVHQVALGQSSRKLEQLYHTSFKQITNWVHRFEKLGIEGLKDKARSGRKTRLSDEQMQRIRQILTDNHPSDYGYNTATWTGPLLIAWIKSEYGVEYKKAQIYNILKKLGLSHQKGRGIYPEADEKQREAFKES
jgi:transposase